MNNYRELVTDVLENGTDSEDRTGTGTKSVFGRQVRYDLSKGFPLLSLKKTYWKGVVSELCWMLSGSTNAHDLPHTVQKWWTPWADSDGKLGPTYGKQFRNVEKIEWIVPRIYDYVPFDSSKKTYGNYNKEGHHVDHLKSVWNDVLKRCYNPKSKSYGAYGAKGVHICPTWFNFENFQRDVCSIPNWNLKIDYPSEYTLDKDILFSSNRYSKKTCMWASHREQSLNTSTRTPFSATNPVTLKTEIFLSFGEAVRSYNLNQSAVHRCLNGKLKTHKNWSNFKYLKKENMVLSYRKVDQLKSLISEIKHSPNSRRLNISLWNPAEIDKMNLPPCHGNMIQFYVRNNRLSCQMYQRSGDLFLGVPVNVAFYSLLTHLIANECELEVGEFIHTFGDLHLYNNHLEQAKECLEREPFAMPKLDISLPSGSLMDFIDNQVHEMSWEEIKEVITLSGYKAHPAIKGEVAV